MVGHRHVTGTSVIFSTRRPFRSTQASPPTMQVQLGKRQTQGVWHLPCLTNCAHTTKPLPTPRGATGQRLLVALRTSFPLGQAVERQRQPSQGRPGGRRSGCRSTPTTQDGGHRREIAAVAWPPYAWDRREGRAESWGMADRCNVRLASVDRVVRAGTQPWMWYNQAFALAPCGGCCNASPESRKQARQAVVILLGAGTF